MKKKLILKSPNVTSNIKNDVLSIVFYDRKSNSTKSIASSILGITLLLTAIYFLVIMNSLVHRQHSNRLHRELDKKVSIWKKELTAKAKEAPNNNHRFYASFSYKELEKKKEAWWEKNQHRLDVSFSDLLKEAWWAFVLIIIAILFLVNTAIVYSRHAIITISKKRAQLTIGYQSTLFPSTPQHFPIKNMEQLFCKPKHLENITTYSLHYLGKNGITHTLIESIFDANDAVFLEKTIEDFLGIEDVDVKGALN